MSRLYLLREVFFIFTSMKPAIDAYRVVSGTKTTGTTAEETASNLDPLLELIALRIVEITCESVPGCVLQLTALFRSQQATFQSILSIVVSFATISFGATSITFLMDLDPERRAHSPTFYGFIPREIRARIVSFVTMLSFCFCK